MPGGPWPPGATTTVAVGVGVGVGGRLTRGVVWPPSGSFLTLDVLDDAREDVPPLCGGDGHAVGEAGFPQESEADGLPLYPDVGIGKAGADEVEPLRQIFGHLAEGAAIAGGDCDPDLAAGRRPVLLKGPGGTAGLRLHDIGLRQQRGGA